jgi:hypothetical protein
MRTAFTWAKKRRPEADFPSLSADLAAPAFRALVREVANTPRPQFVTMDGEELIFCEAHFEAADAKAALEKLAAHPDMDPGDDELIWVDRGGRKSLGHGPLTLGSVRVQGGRLVLEAKSRERLERGKALIAEHLGERVKHRLDSIKDVDAAMREQRERGPRSGPESRIPPELEAELVSQFMQDHLMQWIDEQIPALDGKTPREAVRTAKGRTRVRALLKDQEHSTQRMPGGDRIDFSTVYRALGLEP